MSWGDTCYVRLRLSRWGRWGTDQGPALLPSIFGRLLVSSGCFSSAMREMPAEIAEIDDIIHHVPADLKSALIDYYARQCAFTEGGRERGISAHCFKQLVRRGEAHVRDELF